MRTVVLCFDPKKRKNRPEEARPDDDNSEETMTGDFISANTDNTEEILAYENENLRKLYTSEIEQSLARWNSRWRPESLEHYLKTGWSFLLRDRDIPSSFSPDGALIGYFLAQPLLFLDGQTQSLWVEYISFKNLAARDNLCDFAYRLSKEKHLQKVYFPSLNNVKNSVNTYKASPWAPDVVQVLTTKAQ